MEKLFKPELCVDGVTCRERARDALKVVRHAAKVGGDSIATEPLGDLLISMLANMLHLARAQRVADPVRFLRAALGSAEGHFKHEEDPQFHEGSIPHEAGASGVPFFPYPLP